MKYKMSQFSCRLQKYKHCENNRNYKMLEKLMQFYKVLTVEFLCKDASTLHSPLVARKNLATIA